MSEEEKKAFAGHKFSDYKVNGNKPYHRPGYQAPADITKILLDIQKCVHYLKDVVDMDDDADSSDGASSKRAKRAAFALMEGLEDVSKEKSAGSKEDSQDL